MDSLHLNRRRGHVVAAATMVGTLLAACSSEGSSDVGSAREHAEGSPDDVACGSDEGEKPNAQKPDAGAKAPTDRSAIGTGSDAGTTASRDAGGVKVGGGDLPCAVQAIVVETCGDCHGAIPAAGAPMSLVTQADFQAAAASDESQKVYQVVKTRINAETRQMPPITPLSADDLETLNDWLDQGALAGEETCVASTTPGHDAGGGEEIDVSGLECYKLLAHAQGNKNAKFQLGSAVDRYVNFGFQAPWQGTLYGVVVRPVIDNVRVLHHWLLYREPVADGSIQDTIGQHTGGEMIHGWAPGGLTMDFRKHGDVAFELPASTYSIELHYNSDDPNAADASGVELCGVKTPPKNIASLSWLGYDQGGTLSYATGVCLDPATEWTGTCRPQSQEPIHLMFMVPHLHQTGRHLKAVINGPNGDRVLHDNPFDFNYQVSYETDEVLMPGESITTTCTFSAPNCAGQSTTQEMCYLFTYAYPKHALTDNGFEGTFMHGEGVCLGQ